MQIVFSRGKQNKYIITQMRNIQQTDQGTEHTEGMASSMYAGQFIKFSLMRGTEQELKEERKWIMWI